MPSSSARPLFEAPSHTPKPREAVNAWQSLPALKGRLASDGVSLTSDEREVADIVAQALREADAIRADAASAAVSIQSQAREGAAGIRQDAFVAGYASGLNQAHAEVAEELGIKFDQRLEELHDSVAAVVEAILAEREAMWTEMESEITALALEIARKVLKTEITQNSAVIEAVVRDGLRRVSDRGTVRIIVSPDDIKAVRAGREDLLEAIDGIQNLIIDSDRRVGRGGCVIETAAGSIDSKVETQLDQVEQAMKP